MTIDGLNGTLDLVIDTYNGIKSHVDSGSFAIITSTFNNSVAQKLDHRNVWQINPISPRIPLGFILSVKPRVDTDSRDKLARLIDICSRDPAVKTFLDQNFGAPVQMSSEEIRAMVRKYATYQF